MKTKSKLAIAGAVAAVFTVPALAETSDIEELVRNSGHPTGIQAAPAAASFAQTPAVVRRRSLSAPIPQY
jgi:hypothetical protein